jgi:hypothetical protein
MTTDSEAFEEFAQKQRWHVEKNSRAGNYLHTGAYFAWVGWQAALEHARKPVNLEKCALEIAKRQGLSFEEQAKAVLDAAGVKYHE